LTNNSTIKQNNSEGLQKSIQLLEIESSKAVTSDSGITTVSFFTTTDFSEVKKQLKHNIIQVLKANPWLVGRLIKIKDQPLLQLQYTDNISEAQVDEIFNDELQIAIKLEMPFPEICKQIIKNKSAMISSGLSLINKDKSLIRLSVSHISDNQYALIYSLSHTIADGSTFYRTQNMLFGGEKITALNPIRKQNYSMEKAVGKTDNAFVFYVSFTLNVLNSLIFGRKPKFFSYYINEESIKSTKAEFTGNTEIPYISTNDIISSSFMRAVKARLGMIVINFRNRFPNVDLDDAGNYEGVKLYDAPIYNTPEGIRKSLLGEIPYKTLMNKIPGTWERTHLRMAQVNNWASFSGGFALENCQLQLHLPIIPSTIPFDIAVLYRPKLNRTAILILSKNHNKAFYINNPNNPLSQYLGKPVSETVFND
jgi:hypothetical protein